jgi:hypothetical protein
LSGRLRPGTLNPPIRCLSEVSPPPPNCRHLVCFFTSCRHTRPAQIRHPSLWCGHAFWAR